MIHKMNSVLELLGEGLRLKELRYSTSDRSWIACFILNNFFVLYMVQDRTSERYDMLGKYFSLLWNIHVVVKSIILRTISFAKIYD